MRYLGEVKLEVEEKKETEAQSCLDRIWYSLNWSAKFDRVIISLLASVFRYFNSSFLELQEETAMVIFTDRTMNRKSFGLAWVRWPGPSPPSSL